MKTALAVLVVSASLLVASAAFGSSSATTLKGTVGPGFTISLKKAGKNVKSLKAGTYTFKIADKSDIHDFALKGPVKKTPDQRELHRQQDGQDQAEEGQVHVLLPAPRLDDARELYGQVAGRLSGPGRAGPD